MEPHRPPPPAGGGGLRRWLAHVWPAIPLRVLLSEFRDRGEGAASTATAGHLRHPPGSMAGMVTAGVSGIHDHAAVASPPAAEPRDVSLPVGGEISLLVLLFASAILTALLLFTVRRELGPMHRWPQ